MRNIIISIFLIPLFLVAQQVEKNVSNDGPKYKPGEHELLIMPTAYTMNKGQGYFTDYELYLLNFSYAPTNTTHIGLFTMFPVTSDFLETITLGAKQQLFNKDNIAGALWSTITFKEGLISYGFVLSLGPQQKFNGHLAIGGLTTTGSNSGTEFMYMAGVKGNITQNVGLIAEYTNFETLMDFDFKGFLSFGFRFSGESISWELGGFRPLDANTGDLLLLPLLKATFVF